MSKNQATKWTASDQPTITGQHQPSHQPSIDIAALAEKVYRLMLYDIRLEHARRGSNTSHQRARRPQ